MQTTICAACKTPMKTVDENKCPNCGKVHTTQYHDKYQPNPTFTQRRHKLELARALKQAHQETELNFSL